MGFVVRGYGRASTDMQVLSTEQQESVVYSQFLVNQRTREEWRDAAWGGFFRDEDTKRLSSFRQRPAGSLILAASAPGDFIVVSNFDRIFARSIDAYETLELVQMRGFKLKILDMDIDISTDMGEMLFSIMAAVKGLDVKEIGRRCKNAMKHRTDKGLPNSGKPPIGWKVVAVKDRGRIRKYFQADSVARRYALQLVEFFNLWNVRVAQAYQRCNALGILHPKGTRWSFHTYSNWLRAAQNGFPLPNNSHEAAPIPADAEPVNIATISAD